MNAIRQLSRIIDARPAADGDGVKIKRVAGQHLFWDMDPFLLLDEIRSDDSADYIGGFPPHPHRGFETITYMLEGVMRHRDHMGNEGLLQAGGVQWMTAGRGVIHSEMPEQERGLLHGFQLWLNLPASEKMQPPAYRDFADEEFPIVVSGSGVNSKVVAGSMVVDGKAVRGPIEREWTQPALLDVTIPPGAVFEWSAPAQQTVLVYLFEGESQQLASGQMGVFTGGEKLIMEGAGKKTGVRALVLAGTPLREPVKQYGPFVMNTAEQIEQAVQDFNDGKLAS